MNMPPMARLVECAERMLAVLGDIGACVTPRELMNRTMQHGYTDPEVRDAFWYLADPDYPRLVVRQGLWVDLAPLV